MKKNRILSLILSLMMVVSIVCPMGIYAEEVPVGTDGYTEEQQIVEQTVVEEEPVEEEPIEEEPIEEEPVEEETVEEEPVEEEPVEEEPIEEEPIEEEPVEEEPVEEEPVEDEPVEEEPVEEEPVEEEPVEEEPVEEEPVEEEPAEESVQPFAEGYVIMQAGTLVYPAEEEQNKIGTFLEDATVYAVAAASEGWLWIAFDTAEANEADESLLTGYVLFENATVLSDEETAQLELELQDDENARDHCGYYLPVVAFDKVIVVDESEDEIVDDEIIDDEIIEEDVQDTVETAPGDAGTAVTIVNHPSDASAPVGDYVKFAVTAQNAESYQWQYSKDGISWTNCTTTSWPGADTAEVTAKVTNTRNGYMFRCLVTGGERTIASNYATMSIGAAAPAATITFQPEDAIAPAGEYVKFTVVAENAESYQWQYSKDGSSWVNCTTASWPGADTSEMTAKVTNTRNGYQFRCVVTGGGSDVISAIATMRVGTVTVPVQITSQPVDASAPAGEFVTFKVVAENAESYQWQYSKDGSSWVNCTTASWPGADTSEVTAKVTNTRNGYQFRCVVTGDGSSETSVVVTMTVGTAVTPEPENGPTIKTQPVDASAPIGEYVTFKVVAENAETYQWQYSKTGDSWYNCTTTSWPGADTAEVTAKVTATRNGYQFRCVLTGNGVSVTSDIAIMTEGQSVEPENPPVIKTHPVDASAPAGEYVKFKVEAENAESYQWQYSKNGTTWTDCTTSSWPGADTAEVTAKVTNTRNGYQFRCVVTGNGASVASNEATMTVGALAEPENPPVIKTQPVDAAAPIGEYVKFMVEAENAESYQWQYSKNGTTWYDCTTSSWPGADTAEMTAKVTAGRVGYQFRCVVTGNGASVTSNSATMTEGTLAEPENPPVIKNQPEDVVAPVGEYVTFKVEAENAESYQWQYSANEGTTWTNCTTTSWPGADTAEVTAKVTAGRNGYQFRCVVTGNGTSVASDSAIMTVGNPVVIVSHPEDASAPVGEYVTFKIVAENVETYQWQYSKNGTTWYDCTTTSWPGADTAEVTAKVTATRDGYQFRCVVTGAGKTLESDIATMTVNNNVVIDDVTYEALTSTTCRVISYTGTASTLVIPEVVSGMTVVEIGEEAFMGNTTLVSIDLPDTITIIRARAFKNCSKLSEMK